MTELESLARDLEFHLVIIAQSLLWHAVHETNSMTPDEAAPIIEAVMRVLDAFEAVAQLGPVRELVSDPDRPIPFHPVR